MLHWIYNPTREIKRFLDENIKDRTKNLKKGTKAKQIMQMAQQNGMRPSDINSLILELDVSRISDPVDDTQRIDQLYYMMELMLDDLNFDTAEQDFVKDFAVSIGIPIVKAPYIVMEIYNGMRDELEESEIKHKVLEMIKA